MKRIFLLQGQSWIKVLLEIDGGWNLAVVFMCCFVSIGLCCLHWNSHLLLKSSKGWSLSTMEVVLSQECMSQRAKLSHKINDHLSHSRAVASRSFVLSTQWMKFGTVGGWVQKGVLWRDYRCEQKTAPVQREWVLENGHHQAAVLGPS